MRAILECSEQLEREIQAARSADRAMKTMAQAFLIVGVLTVGGGCFGAHNNSAGDSLSLWKR